MLDCAPRAVPEHWIGVWKGWPQLCSSIAEALVEITPEQLSTHAVLVGSTGSGKTNGFHHMIAGDLLRGHSIAVLDARGEVAMATIELAARSGVDPNLIRFFDLREKNQPLGFSPFAGGGEPYFRALGFLDAVAAGADSWGVQLAETLRNGALLIAETGANLTSLESLFYHPAIRQDLIARTKSKSLREFWQRYDGLSTDRQAALATPVMNKISALLSTEGLRLMFGHPEPVDIGQHLRTPGSITLVSLAVDELHSAGRMVGSMLLSSICREVFSQVDTPESQRNPVRLYVDEFEHFGWNQFETILAEGRRFKFSVVVGHQSLAQLSPKMRSLILGNVGVKLVFSTSYADAEILNRDLTGSKGTFPLASLQVGEAILWRRGDNAWPIEINAPLITDVGSTSPICRELLDRLRAQTPRFFASAGLTGTPDDELITVSKAEPQSTTRRMGNVKKQGSLEDWLI